MNTFAIAIIGYKKYESIKRLMKSIEKVDFNNRRDISLIFSIDYSDDNQNVREFAENYHWSFGEKRLIIYNQNQGLKKHIISVGDLTKEYDILVVLEDDLYVSDSMYNYAYHAANFYRDDDRIAGISLYNFNKHWINTINSFNPEYSGFDTYFLKLAQSWGQVWIKEKWVPFREWFSKNSTFVYNDKLPKPLKDWSSKSSWLKFHNWYCIVNNKYFVYPYYSLSTNFSDPGTHSRKLSNDSQSIIVTNKKDFNFQSFISKSVIYDEFMERENMGKYLELENDTLTVDLYGNKSKKNHKRYLLSTIKYDYRVIKTFQLSLKPIEVSVINNIEGNGIFLYDTEIISKNKFTNYKYQLLSYSLGISTFNKLRVLFFFSLSGICKSIIAKIKKQR